MKVRLALAFWILLNVAEVAQAAPCDTEDFESKVSGAAGCLLMRRYGSATPSAMMVWIHGNASTGGPANSHFRLAKKAADDFAAHNILSVALVRPGYPDGTGEFSSGSDNGRADNWPRTVIAEIGTAIDRLKSKFKPDSVILVGHSGGAAIAAVLLGLKPQLAEAAVLVACPCDMIAWRAGRSGRPWVSENPIQWVRDVSPTAKVIALTGSKDTTTAPVLGRTYIEKLKARGIDAVFEMVPDFDHLDILKSQALSDAISRFLRR